MGIGFTYYWGMGSRSRWGKWTGLALSLVCVVGMVASFAQSFLIGWGKCGENLCVLRSKFYFQTMIVEDKERRRAVLSAQIFLNLWHYDDGKLQALCSVDRHHTDIRRVMVVIIVQWLDEVFFSVGSYGNFQPFYKWT